MTTYVDEDEIVSYSLTAAKRLNPGGRIVHAFLNIYVLLYI